MTRSHPLPAKPDMMSEMKQRHQSRKTKDNDNAVRMDLISPVQSKMLAPSSSSPAVKPAAAAANLNRCLSKRSDVTSDGNATSVAMSSGAVEGNFRLERLKEEIVSEIRREMKKVKSEIIEAVKLELSGSQ